MAPLLLSTDQKSNSRMDRRSVEEQMRRAIEQGDPTGWFEPLYAAADGDASVIGWAHLSPNPLLVDWLKAQPTQGERGRAVVVGCGLGDDAEELARAGFDVTAFDIAPTAIEWCRHRFPETTVDYRVIDLFRLPADWKFAFDFVLESYTLQALPAEIRRDAGRQVAQLVASGGRLLVLCRAREPHEAVPGPPWPLTRDDLSVFPHSGLTTVRFEDIREPSQPSMRRFRVEYQR